MRILVWALSCSCVFASRCSLSWDPCGLLYRVHVAPCVLVFPVVQLWCEQCCCLIDWALCLPCSVTDSEALSSGRNVISAQAALHQGLKALAACFNILTQLSQLMNSIRDPWASTYKLMDKHTHKHPRKLSSLHLTEVQCAVEAVSACRFFSFSPIPCVYSLHFFFLSQTSSLCHKSVWI